MALTDNLVEYWQLTSNDLVGVIAGTTLTATNFAYEAGSPGPAWKVGAGGGRLETTALSLSEPFTIAVQVYVGGGGLAAYVAYAKAGDNYFELYQDSSSNVQARSRSGGSAADAASGGVTGGTFNNVAGVWESSTARRSHNAGSFGSDNTTSITVSGGSSRLTVATVNDASDGAGDTFRFKNLAVWSRTLSDAELDSFFADPSQLEGGGGSAAGAAAHYYRQMQ